MSKKVLLLLLILLVSFLWIARNQAFTRVVREEGKVYIVDQTGERWDVTQAESIGFKPDGFQYGIGRNAFTPLDDSYLKDRSEDVPGSLRVLGVSEDSEAKAYSIDRLYRHEIANSKIGSNPIAVGF
jgi:hypothetical protein